MNGTVTVNGTDININNTDAKDGNCSNDEDMKDLKDENISTVKKEDEDSTDFIHHR